MEHKNQSFSIIIPVKSINDYVRETVSYIQNLNYEFWDVYILPNNAEDNEWNDPRINIVPTGRISPGRKRDKGAALSCADIIVFLDDDSYPEPNLLNIANQQFSQNEIIAVGGPAITPRTNSFWQKVSGAVFLSRFSGGFPERYIPIGETKSVDDWPSVNLMLRKKAFQEIGGFDSDFWPGEDTLLCLKIVENLKVQISYVPDLIVWHHRRAGIFSHLKQVGAYGLHRGYLARKNPRNSLKFTYFIPSFFLFFTILSISTHFIPNDLTELICIGWAAYALALAKAMADIQKIEGTRVALATLVFIFATHLWYGAKFFQGIFSSSLKSQLR
ncbi:glycosyltransferase [bacterium]|nr:glycosyltransferase [bacterium]